MPKFTITTTCRATIRETWTIDAENAEEAQEAFETGGASVGFVGAEIAEVDGDIEEETDREVESVEPAE